MSGERRNNGSIGDRANPEYASVRQAAKILGVSRDFLLAAIKRGEIVAPKKGGRTRRVCLDAVRAWLDTPDDPEPDSVESRAARKARRMRATHERV